VITGAGERAFSTGMDLKMIAESGLPFRDKYPDKFDHIDALKAIFTAYEELDVPVIAAITAIAWERGWNWLCAAISASARKRPFSVGWK
jgi:enoyl-CoA hydratase/carnithine racemase